MTDQTMKKTPGWIVLAAIMLFGMGGFALLAAIADLTNGSWIQELSIFGDRLDSALYGVLDLIIGLTAIYAGLATMRGMRSGYWWGLIFSTLGALRWFIFMPGAPIWALAMVTIWVLVAYGLATNQDYFDEGATKWAGERMVEQERQRDQWH